MKNDYRKGDFLRLKQPIKFQNKRITKNDLNIFEVIEVVDEDIRFRHIETLVPISEVEPIPIDGISDKEIYYDPIIAASVILPGDPIPIRKRDYTYYFDKFANCTSDDYTFQELVTERRFRFVHEIQHFLKDEFNDDGLKIKDY